MFGATSSPVCANFGLKKKKTKKKKQIENDVEKEYGSDAVNFFRNNFDVDHGLKYVLTTNETI